MALTKTSTGRTKSSGASPPTARNQVRIDFNMLTLASLRKYRRYHRLRMKPTSSKMELVAACSEHFSNMQMTAMEDRVIDSFITTVRNAVAAGQTDAKSYGKPKKAKRHEGFLKSSKPAMLNADLTSVAVVPPSPQIQKNL